MATPSISINIFIFKINSFENASAVNIGENFLLDWQNSSKKNQGFGEDNGHLNPINLPVVSTIDNDLLDGTSQKTSFV